MIVHQERKEWPHSTPAPSEWGLALRATFSILILGTFLLLVLSKSPWLKTLHLVFVSILLEALPFMLLGSMVSGLVEVFLSRERLANLLPRRRLVLTGVAAALGVLFPVCECAIVPVVRRFLRKGIPLSAAVAYLLAGPIFNPVVGTSTAVAYYANPGGQTAWIVMIRLLSGFVIALGIGMIMGSLFPGRSALLAEKKDTESRPLPPGRENLPETRHSQDSKITTRFSRRVLWALNHGADDFLDITQFLIIGAFIASLLQTTISRQVFLEMAQSPWMAIPLMMVLAFVLNLCSEADAFIASSFRGILPLSAQMAFMVLGPMLDIKLIIMYLGVFQKKTILVLSLLILITVFLIMLFLHFVMGSWYTLPNVVGISPF